MDLHWLKPLLGRPAPFTTVYLDATRDDATGAADVQTRWKALRRQLERDGSPEAVLAAIDDLVARPTHVPGPHGRVLVADAQEVLVDRVLTEPPAQSTAACGSVPLLLAAARAADESTRFLLVEVNRQGADYTWTDGSGLLADVTETVEGDHDEMHKVGGGGWAHRRWQQRVQDSWERNVDTVAADLDRQVTERKPELVILTGDVRAVALLKDAVGQEVREVLVEVPGGSRAEGVNEEAFQERIDGVLAEHRVRRRESVLDLFRQEQGRGEDAVTSLADVVAVLQRGQVSELVLGEPAAGSPGPLADRRLWVGDGPLELAVSKDDLAAIGVTDAARQMPADVALVRAAVGQDAGLTFADDGAVELVDGVGAILRWRDESTPRESVLSQSADSRRVHNVL
ncbi:Vms1/Ankzf1 family peptidyl-tRNA hydrolase [Cellulomonas sp. 179-A 9B4 NHS]|uniref:baeRF2 domain-containing protein n=1 Tax=Cellulomonas sp. 179-A 9B4 NHS TaxID=3142379 RepID=UPI0039A0C611